MKAMLWTGQVLLAKSLLELVIYAGAEFLAVLGLIAPGLTGMWPMATPLAALLAAFVCVGRMAYVA